MNHLSRSTALRAGPGASLGAGLGAGSATAPDDSPPSPAPLYVRHAVLDARAGLPVMLLDPHGRGPAMIVLPAETATPDSLARFRAALRGDTLLILAASRADALQAGKTGGGDAALRAFRLPSDLLAPDTLHALADPALAQRPAALIPASPPALAAASLALAKLARLLPAMLVAEALPSETLVVVCADSVLDGQARATASLRRVAEARLPLEEAPDSRLFAYRPEDGGTEHVALLIGRPELPTPGAEAPLARIHSECFTGDLLGSLRCDCGPQLHQAIRRMAAEGAGVLLYMAQEGRGIGLVNKLRAYALQDRGLDTLDANRALGWGADERDFTTAAVMLRDLGIPRIRLLTNNPEKVAALAAAGIEVAGRVRHAIAANGVNDGYLETKARRFGHLLG